MRYALVALVGFFTFQSALAHPVTLHAFDLTPIDKGALVQLDSSSEKVDVSSVRVPVEGVVFQTRAPEKLVEADVFQSGLALDINGDGDTNDVFDLSREGGKDYLQDVEIEPFARSLDSQQTGRAKVYQLTSSGPKFVVYRTNPELVAGMDYKGREAGFIDLPNPSLQLMLIEECERPEGKPGIVLKGANRLVFAFEKGLNSSGNRWHRIQWMPLMVDREHKIELRGEGEAYLVCFVNWAPEEGIRKRDVLRAVPLKF